MWLSGKNLSPISIAHSAVFRGRDVMIGVGTALPSLARGTTSPVGRYPKTMPMQIKEAKASKTRHVPKERA